MVSNDVDAGRASCAALLLTPKARLIAPLRVWRRGDEDFLLLTEPELGEAVRATLLRVALRREVRDRARGAHVGRRLRRGGRASRRDSRAGGRGARRRDRATTSTTISSARGSSAGARVGKELDDSILPAEAGLDETHDLLHEGLLPGPGAGRAAPASWPGQPRAAGPRGRGGSAR